MEPASLTDEFSEGRSSPVLDSTALRRDHPTVAHLLDRTAPARTAVLAPPSVPFADTFDQAAGRGYRIVKRIFDLTLCLLVLPAALITLIVLAVAIRMDSPGPVFFSQIRIGRLGKPFRIYKLRTLRADHDQQAGRAFMQAYIQGDVPPNPNHERYRVNKPIADVSITRFGRFLRRSSLDELPQIWNVVRGEMSLVGPRPNVPWEVDAYADWHRERLLVLPGITGLAQIRGRSVVTFDAIVQADIEYVRRRSFFLDLEIMWRTVRCLVTGDGAA